MKENLISDKSLIYQWTFNDNISVCDNPRVKANVFGNPTYNNGVATFNGSTDYYKLKTLINLGTKYSIEVKFKQSAIVTGQILLGGDSNNKLSIETATIRHKATTEKTVAYTPNLNWNTLCFTRSGDNYAIYNNGVSLVSGTGMGTSNFLFNVLGALADFTLKYAGQLEYIKIWNRQLSSSEVKNNYNGKTYKRLPYKDTTLFHINSDTGVIRDLTRKTTPVATNIQLPKIGSNINVMKFNGSSGNVNLGSQALVGDITFMGWNNNTTKGENNTGTLLHNGQVYLRNVDNQDSYLIFSRNNGINFISSFNNTLKFSNNQFICITSTLTGITNIYIGDKNNPPTLSGAANQNAGIPVAGSTCYLGNRSTDDRTMNGWLNDIRMEQSILTLEEITNYYSATKYKY